MPESPMPQGITRRSALKAAAAGLTLPWGAAMRRALADDEIQSHGLSAFGDLALPADFKHFDYVNPDAPKGGLLSLQITATDHEGGGWVRIFQVKGGKFVAATDWIQAYRDVVASTVKNAE